MNVWRSVGSFESGKRTVLSVGNFDGVHRGHAALVAQVARQARQEGHESMLVTFDPHTRTGLTPSRPQPVLSTFEEKSILLSRLGLDHLVRVEFDESVRRMNAAQFVEQLVVGRLRASAWVMGEGHTFGSDRVHPGGTLHNLLSRNDIRQLPQSLLADAGKVVSSTGIRASIMAGDMDKAVAMLGHGYLIAAPRVKGLGLGTKLGYPTLNFARPSPDKVIPPPGVYAARVQVGETMVVGALYFGTCPTFQEREVHFEMHLLERAPSVPELGQSGLLWVYRYVRPDRVFRTGDELVEQIAKDVNTIQSYFREGEVVCP
jgi:riboflavin kinase / FMN adenylyltransferase